ncbi:MAG: response regulator [Anaerolineae bacterium]|nr:response regulator [Anaerolineae bacterium]
MSGPLTVLIVADQPEEVDRLLRTLHTAGFEVTHTVVATDTDFQAHLTTDLDLILADPALPQFDGLRALELLQTYALDAPLIVVTDSANENIAVNCMQHGATDYLLNDRLARLGLAVRRALAQQQLREAQTAADMQFREAQWRFISVASHEFRNPLAVILMNSDILHRYHNRLAPEQRDKYQQGVRLHIQHLTELLEALLLISQAAAGKLEIKTTTVDLVPFIQQTVDEVWAVKGANRALNVTMPDSCEITIDAKLFRLIVVHLVANAAQYTQDGGTVIVTLVCTPERIVFTVQDDGIGIPETDRLRIYQTFYRGSNVGSRKGNGIGLALIKHCAVQLGGTVNFDSQENAGTTFTLTLPHNAVPFTSNTASRPTP